MSSQKVEAINSRPPPAVKTSSMATLSAHRGDTMKIAKAAAVIGPTNVNAHIRRRGEARNSFSRRTSNQDHDGDRPEEHGALQEIAGLDAHPQAIPEEYPEVGAEPPDDDSAGGAAEHGPKHGRAAKDPAEPRPQA